MQIKHWIKLFLSRKTFLVDYLLGFIQLKQFKLEGSTDLSSLEESLRRFIGWGYIFIEIRPIFLPKLYFYAFMHASENKAKKAGPIRCTVWIVERMR